jgi:hypothetical protein
MGLPVFSDFETMATWWLKGKRYNPVNVFSSAVLGLEEKKQLVFSGGEQDRNDGCDEKLC